jgi:hypothetical protein
MRNNTPAPALTGDLARVVLQYKGPGGLYQTVHDYMANGFGVLTTAVLSALASAFETAVQPSLLNALSNQVTVTQYTAEDLNPSKAPSQTVASNTGGNVAAAPLPSEMCATVRKNSTLKGQHGRGRISLPGVPVTFPTPTTNPDVIGSTGLSVYATLCTALQNSLTAAGVNFVPVITTRPSSPGAMPTNAQPTSSWTTDATLGTTRRRKPGRGR